MPRAIGHCVSRHRLQGHVLVLLVLSLFLVAPARALEPPVLVFEPATGQVLKAENADALWYPASLTKLMTAYLVFDAIAAGRTSLQDTVTMSAAAARMPPSRFSGRPGTTFSVHEGLLLLVVKSANDVAHALAEHVAGSHDAFVRRMNAKARQLGMTRTHFVNPHGLHSPDQVTTARDMARLVTALLRNHGKYAPLFRVDRVTIAGREFASHNKLLGRYQGADGLKTGYVCSAGWNMIASATRNGRRLVAITLGNMNARDRADTAAALLDEAFASWGLVRPTLADLPVQGASSRPLDMRPTVCRKTPQMAVAGPVPSFLAASQGDSGDGETFADVAASAGDPASDTGEGAPLPPRRPLFFANTR